ncbi:HNH endonuclease [Nostoc sp.]|uniref:HNH endonuclease n=1 Tax=Nostoc sp. TaxID=1180 RepID=UPI002FFC0B35
MVLSWCLIDSYRTQQRRGESLLNDKELHLHHKKPKSQGGGDNYGNLQLVHLYCHQQIHSGTICSL